MSCCAKCGEYDFADGGIGCVCGQCPRCRGGDGEYCFLCRPCKVCNRAIEMHVGCKECQEKDD